MDRKPVVYVNQTLGPKAACGIGIIGDLIAKSLVKSQKYEFRVVYADDHNAVAPHISSDVVAVVYHYALGSTPWVNNNPLLSRFPDVKHIKTHHDMTQAIIDRFTVAEHGGFRYVIADDPTLVGNDHVFTTQRLIPPHTPRVAYSDPEVPIIGFQGFGPPHKGISKLAHRVQEEFDEAIIRLHIPFGYYGDPHGDQARQRVREVRSIINKPGISVVASHELLPMDQIVDLLAQNTVNCYFYDYLDGCGLASSPDFALAARRPIAITRSHQFRNLWNLEPSILIEHRSLRDIIASGTTPLEPLYDAYTEQNVIADYEGILDRILES